MLINKSYILTIHKEHLKVLEKQRDSDKSYGAHIENTIKVDSVKYIIGLIEKDMEDENGNKQLHK